MPLALDHNDLHDNNAFVSTGAEATLRFFDFGDALWAHPFGSMLVVLNVVTDPDGLDLDAARIAWLLDAYLERGPTSPRSRSCAASSTRRWSSAGCTDTCPGTAASWVRPRRPWASTPVRRRRGWGCWPSRWSRVAPRGSSEQPTPGQPRGGDG